jgi:iron complex transport system substrate-binding protein
LRLLLAVACLCLLGGPPAAGAGAPPRIVSLAPNLTEIAFAAGAGQALVGTVEYSDYPEAARKVPRVGNAWRVDMERVLAMHPDVVLVWPSGTPDSVIEQLRRLGLKVEAVPTYRLSDVPAALRRIGAMAGSAALAEQAAAKFERDVAAQRAAHAGLEPLSVFIEIDDEPLFTVNGEHVISEVVRLCGGRNVFAKLPQIAPPVSLESVLESDPQVIVTTDDTIPDPVGQWAKWPRLTAVRAKTIYSLPSDLVTRATPRLAEGVRVTCAALDDARRRLGP